jgi:hypothetical protein
LLLAFKVNILTVVLFTRYNKDLRIFRYASATEESRSLGRGPLSMCPMCPHYNPALNETEFQCMFGTEGKFFAIFRFRPFGPHCSGKFQSFGPHLSLFYLLKQIFRYASPTEEGRSLDRGPVGICPMCNHYNPVLNEPDNATAPCGSKNSRMENLRRSDRIDG